MSFLLFNSDLIRQSSSLDWQFWFETTLSPAWLVPFTSRSSSCSLSSLLFHFLGRLNVNTEFWRRVFKIFLIWWNSGSSGLMRFLGTWRWAFNFFYNWRCFNTRSIGTKFSQGHWACLRWGRFWAGIANTLIHMGWIQIRVDIGMHGRSKLLHRLWLKAEGWVTFIAIKVIWLKINLLSFKIWQVWSFLNVLWLILLGFMEHSWIHHFRVLIRIEVGTPSHIKTLFVLIKHVDAIV